MPGERDGARDGEILAALTVIMRRICRHDQIALSATTPLVDIAGIDSLRLLQSVAELEEHFQVEIDVAVLERLHRVNDIVRAIAEARTGASR